MVGQHGQYVKEKCDGCGKPPQQTFVYRAIGVTDSAGPATAGTWVLFIFVVIVFLALIFVLVSVYRKFSDWGGRPLTHRLSPPSVKIHSITEDKQR
jgi:hypothetical protein